MPEIAYPRPVQNPGRPDRAADHGAAAFVMAEILGASYVTVIVAAVLPALLVPEKELRP